MNAQVRGLAPGDGVYGYSCNDTFGIMTTRNLLNTRRQDIFILQSKIGLLLQIPIVDANSGRILIQLHVGILAVALVCVLLCVLCRNI